MTDYSKINEWFAMTLKNKYYFSTKRPAKDAWETHNEYREALNTLTASLTDKMGREEYLQWRKTWREIYAKLTEESRLAKNFRSTTLICETNSEATVEQAELSIAPLNQDFVRRYKMLANQALSLRSLSKAIAATARENEQEAA